MNIEDTTFIDYNGKLRLMQLFGMQMEEDADNPARLTGVMEIFSSLGSADANQKLLDIKNENDKIIISIELYGGTLLYMSEWKYDRELKLFVRHDRITNQSKQPVRIYKALQRYVFQYTEMEAYMQSTRWCYENMGNWQKVQFGGFSICSESGRTTQGATPYLALRNSRNKGLVFHIVPNGNWKMELRTQTLGSDRAGDYVYVLELGQSDRHFAMELKPGEYFDYPEVIIQKLCGGSIVDTAVNLQRYFLKIDDDRHRVTHAVTYNPWYEHYALLDVNRLKEHVKAAKELGCENFEIDAGWYGSDAGDWWSQAGDWTERQNDAFYGKMREFSDYVREQGMNFGLWMEPERVGTDVPIRKQHPEYFVLGNGYYYPKLYETEVYDWLYGQISGLIEKYDLRWMKMDFNFELAEDLTGSEFYLYYKAWYRLLNEVKENYPQTFLEACAAGGMRNDIRTAMTFDGHFLSDNTNAWDMQATYEQCCLRLPHYRLIKWLVVSPGARISLYASKKVEKIPTVITPQAPGAGWDEYEHISPEFACQLVMAGPPGLSGNFIDLTPEQKEIFKKYIAFYKEYRSFFRNCVVILGAEPNNVGNRNGFYHLQYSKEDTGEQLVFIYRFVTATKKYHLQLKNLDETRIYQIKDAISGDKVSEASGRKLMEWGMYITLESRHSGEVLYIS